MREIVSESAIYVRERLVNLKIPSYVFSKFTVLSGIALIQCVLFIGILSSMGRLNIGDFPSLTFILYLTSLAGIAMGLFFSALVNSTEKAMSVLPLILIPQLLLSGYLNPIEDVYHNIATKKAASAAQYQRYQEAKDQKDWPQGSTSPLASTISGEPIEKIKGGLGLARYAAALMVARWTIEALAHDVSINDKDARDKLPMFLTISEYERVLAGKPEDEIALAYRTRVATDWAVLALFSVVFLLLTMWALKRKDVL